MRCRCCLLHIQYGSRHQEASEGIQFQCELAVGGHGYRTCVHELCGAAAVSHHHCAIGGRW